MSILMLYDLLPNAGVHGPEWPEARPRSPGRGHQESAGFGPVGVTQAERGARLGSATKRARRRQLAVEVSEAGYWKTPRRTVLWPRRLELRQRVRTGIVDRATNTILFVGRVANPS